MAAGVLAGVLSGGLSMLGDYVSSRQKYWESRDLAKFANKMDVKNWEMENEYNKPINQMARLSEAGLNPNLMYGTGQGANQAGNIQKYQSMEPANTSYGNGPVQVLQALSAYTDVKAKQANIDNIEAQTRTRQLENDFLSGTLEDRTRLEYEKWFDMHNSGWSKNLSNVEQQRLLNESMQKYGTYPKSLLFESQLKQSQQTALKVEQDAFIRKMEADLYRQIDKIGAGGTGSSIMKNLLKILVSRLGG